MKPSVCFFAKVQDRQTLERVEFYAQDIQILRDLGFDIQIAVTPAGIRRADFYYVWWWTWAFFPLATAKVLRRPVLITGVFDTPSMQERSFLHRRLITGALKAADTNVFLSDDEMIEIPGTYKVTRPRMVPLSVDADVYRPAGPRERFVLSIGWLEGGNAVRKGMPEIIRAAPLVRRTHPDVRFLIGGVKGSYYPILEALVREVGASSFVEFLGEVPKERKIDLMQRCQVYLQPSRREGFGLAILEAMSCGAPVVTCPVGAVPEVVGDAAVLVDGTSVEGIAAAVIGLLDDADRRRDVGLRARRRAETMFSYARRREGLAKVIAETLGGR